MEIVFDYRKKGSGREQQRIDQLLACLQTYIGHELPNQLVPIQAFARLLVDHHADALGEEARLLLERLAALAQRTDVLARRLADITRLLRDPPWGSSLSLDEVVREAVAEVKLLGIPAGISYEAPKGLPTVHASRRLLHQVLVQLLRNAGQAMTAQVGSVSVGGQRLDSARDRPPPRFSHPSLAPGETGVLVWVRDSGRGLTNDQVGLFEPFAAGRFPNATGPGLGMFLVRQAAARWGGVLRVQSEVGQGSTFSLFIPDPEEKEEG